MSESSSSPGIEKHYWWGLAILLLLGNAPVLASLARTWWYGYAEMGHGLIAVPLAVYVLWLKKENFKTLPIAGSASGLWLFSGALCLIVVSVLAQWIFFSQIGFWFLIVGSVWYLLGSNWLRELGFPLLLLLLAIPPPTFLYTRVTFELQLLASRLGEFGLETLGYSVLREGNILRMANINLSVAEACSGIRSLITLLFFVIVYGYFMVDSTRTRFILALAAIPIAVFMNSVRIVASGVLSQIDRSLAEGFTHELSGYITLFSAGALCILLEQQLHRRNSTA